ncbi:MAG: AAA family ATPase [Thermomicrobiales bacterium]
MSEVESRPISWLWDRWLARGKIHLLGGHAGEGKSLLTAAIAAQMSSGSELPDGKGVSPVRTLFLLAEDDVADTVKPRLELHAARMESIFFIEAVREIDRPKAIFSLRRHLQLLEEAIREYGIDVLIIDPLSAFLQGSERNSEEVRDLLTPLADLAALDRRRSTRHHTHRQADRDESQTASTTTGSYCVRAKSRGCLDASS